MDNEHKVDMSEDEYHLPESESQNVYGQAPMQGPDQTKRRKILLVIGLVVLVLAGYKLLGLFFGNRTAKVPVATTTTTTVVKAPIAQETSSPLPPPTAVQETPSPLPPPTTVQETPSPLPPPTVTQETPGPPPTVAQEAITQKVPSLATMQTTQTTTTTTSTPTAVSSEKVEGEIGTLNNNLNDIESKLARLNERLDEMQSTVKQQPPPLPLARTRVCEKRVVIVRKVIAVPRPHYFIQAILPGRAWLMNSRGDILTVARGDILPGYGKISLVDAIKGIVVTNKGAIIRFKGA